MTDDILDIALGAGALILQNGGETYRTEDTMVSVAHSLGAASSSAFVTPTVAMLTCVDTLGRSHTRIARISERTINLGRIAQVNELARRIATRSERDLSRVSSMLERIGNSSLHHPVGVVFATALSSFCFSLLFTGTLIEALLAFVIGAILRCILFLIAPLDLSPFIVSLVGGFAVSLLSHLAVLARFAQSAGNVSISVLMILVPGLAIVNAIRDIIAGDLMAGSARLLEAFVIAAALSLGAAFGLMLFQVSLSSVSANAFLAPGAVSYFLAFFATGSFAWFFYINRYDILWASLIGGAGWLSYLVASQYFALGSGAWLVGALVVGVLSEFAASAFKKPATVYIVPGIIPLVPGGGMYETMLAFVRGNMEQAATTGFTTLSAAAAIAVGIALATSFARLSGKVRLIIAR
jgi:uncharacterized membrane protein YjjP (DUF1212 family)